MGFNDFVRNNVCCRLSKRINVEVIEDAIKSFSSLVSSGMKVVISVELSVVGLSFNFTRESTDSLISLGREVTVTGVIMRGDVCNTLGDALFVGLTNTMGVIIISRGFV